MGIMTTIIIIIIIITVITFLVLIIINLNKLKQPIVTGKSVINRLDKFTDGHKIGSLIKRVPVGKNKDYVRIHFTVKEKDEFDNDKIAEKKIVVHKFYLKETDDILEICPKHTIDIPLDEVDGKNLKEYIIKQNGLETFAKAMKTDKERSDKLFIEHFGGLMTEIQLKKAMDLRKITEEGEKEDEKQK